MADTDIDHSKCCVHCTVPGKPDDCAFRGDRDDHNPGSPCPDCFPGVPSGYPVALRDAEPPF